MNAQVRQGREKCPLVGRCDALAQIGDGKAIGNFTRPEFRNAQAVPFNNG